MSNWGLRSIDDIIKAASQSSSMPFFAKEAAMGMVPYMHKGEAMPISDAGIRPNAPSFFPCMEAKSR